MKKYLIAVAMLAALTIPASAQLSSQQQRVKDCNSQASGMSGDARKQFMSSCLSGVAAETKKPNCAKASCAAIPASPRTRFAISPKRGAAWLTSSTAPRSERKRQRL